MNAIHTQPHLDATIDLQHVPAANPPAGVIRGMRHALGALRTTLERRAVVADEKARWRTQRDYHRKQAALEPDAFRFDPRTDDLFARYEG